MNRHGEIYIPDTVLLRAQPSPEQAIFEYIRDRHPHRKIKHMRLQSVAENRINREYLVIYVYEREIVKGPRISRGRGPTPRKFQPQDAEANKIRLAKNGIFSRVQNRFLRSRV